MDARVTFPFSEVLQSADLVNKAVSEELMVLKFNKKMQATFNCDDGCSVYVDRGDASLTITQNGQFIAKCVYNL